MLMALEISSVLLRASWIARVEPGEERLSTLRLLLALGELSTGRSTVPLGGKRRREKGRAQLRHWSPSRGVRTLSEPRLPLDPTLSPTSASSQGLLVRVSSTTNFLLLID